VSIDEEKQKNEPGRATKRSNLHEMWRDYAGLFIANDKGSERKLTSLAFPLGCQLA
jgi:hypothetical protein